MDCFHQDELGYFEVLKVVGSLLEDRISNNRDYTADPDPWEMNYENEENRLSKAAAGIRGGVAYPDARVFVYGDLDVPNWHIKFGYHKL